MLKYSYLDYPRTKNRDENFKSIYCFSHLSTYLFRKICSCLLKNLMYCDKPVCTECIRLHYSFLISHPVLPPDPPQLKRFHFWPRKS